VNARALLDNRRGQDVCLQVNGGRLMVDTPAGALPDKVEGALAEHKPKLLKLLGWEQRKLREADRRGVLLRWSKQLGWIKLHDLMDGSWHEIRAAECLPSVVESASEYQKRGGGGR
jgi:hypothetical protein